MPTKPPTKFGPAELAHYRAEEIDPRTNAEWRKERMTHQPAPPWEQLGITEEEFNQKQEKANALAHMLKEEFGDPIRAQQGPGDPAAENSAQFPSISDPDPIHEAAQDAEIERQERRASRKLRSDIGVKRGPKSPGELEVSALAPTGDPIPIALTDVQHADLEAEAARWMKSAGLEARYLTAAPSEVLLNARVQKHWRTLVGK